MPALLVGPAERLAAAQAAVPAGEVHTARKALKQLRALAALVGAPKRDDRALRDAGRLLAGARDAEVLAGLLDVIGPSLDASTDDFEAARAELARDVERTRAALDLDGTRRLLVDVAGRIGAWPSDPDLAKGFRRGYKDARDRPADYHEWRKAVKRHWHHCEALGLEERAERVHELSDLLGDDHDLHVLGERLPTLAGMSTVVAARQGALREQSLALGAALFEAKPSKATEELLGSLDP